MAGFPTNGEISRHRIAYTGSVSPAALSFRAMIHDAAIPAFAQTAKVTISATIHGKPWRWKATYTRIAPQTMAEIPAKYWLLRQVRSFCILQTVRSPTRLFLCTRGIRKPRATSNAPMDTATIRGRSAALSMLHRPPHIVYAYRTGEQLYD